MKLYELTGAMLQLLEMAENEEINELIEIIDLEIEEKADGYAKIINQLKGDVETIKTEEKRLSEKRKVIENNIERIKSNLEKSMIAIEKTKFKTNLFSFSIAKNPPKVVLTGEVPEEYTKQVISTDTVKIKEDLKDGIWLEFAELVQTESLRIK